MNLEFEKPAPCFDCGKEFPVRIVPFSGPITVCPTCCNIRFNARQITLSREDWVVRASKALVPARYQFFTDTPALKRARQWVDAALACQRPIYLQGPVRVGKTLALSLLAREFIHAEYQVYFIHCSDFAVYLRGNPNLHTEWHQRLSNCHHLILDDLGAQHDGTGWFSGWLGGVINNRYSNLRPTSVSTNMPEAIESRVASRLKETCLIVESK